MEERRYPRPTTPFLDALAARGQLVTNALVPLPATGPSHASYLTALHPLQHSVLANAMVLPESALTMAEALRARGYLTMGAVGAFPLGRRYGFAQGFDVFSDEWPLVPPLDTKKRRGAPSVNEAVFRMLESYRSQRGGQPLFLFVHYFDLHGPYGAHLGYELPGRAEPPASVRSHRRPLAGLIDRYDSAVRFVDEHIARLYGRLEDPQMIRNLAARAEEQEAVKELAREGERERARLAAAALPASRTARPLTPEEVEALKSLGYLR